MKNLLITREEERSQEIVKLLKSRGFNVFFERLFEVTKFPEAFSFSKEYLISGLIVTSVNAVLSIKKSGLPKDVRIFSVGKRTAEELIRNGFKNVIIAPKKSAKSLVNFIKINHQNKSHPLLYFQGSVTSLDFKKELEFFGFKVENILAYETHPKQNFSENFLEIYQKTSFEYVLIFSQNSAKIFFNLAKQHNLLEYFSSAKILCLSPKILEEARNLGFQNSAIFTEIPTLSNFYD